MTNWTRRKTPIGEVVIVDRVTGETSVFILGGKPLRSQSYGLTPAQARETAAALVAAADEVDAVLAAAPLTLFDSPGG